MTVSSRPIRLPHSLVACPLLAVLIAASAACGDDASPAADIGANDVIETPDAAADAADDITDATPDATADGSPEDAEDDAGPDAPGPPPEWPLTALTDLGPNGIGFRTETISYDPEGDEPGRSIRLALWYPSDEREGRRPRYFVGATSTIAVQDGAYLAGSEPRPVLLYSHGHLGYAEASSRLMEHFASHGWFVVAVTHTGNTSGNFSTPRETPIYHVRSQDLRAALDHLEALPAEHPLVDAADTARTVAMGHSFGGYSVLSLGGATWDMDRWETECATTESGFCSRMDAEQAAIFRGGFDDPRVQAVIPMAAGDFELYGASGLGATRARTLHVIGTEDDAALPMWCGLAHGNNLRLEIIGGGHQAFTDACGLSIGVTLGCTDDQISADDGLRLLGGWTLAFACVATESCGWLTEPAVRLIDGREVLDERALRVTAAEADCDGT